MLFCPSCVLCTGILLLRGIVPRLPSIITVIDSVILVSVTSVKLIDDLRWRRIRIDDDVHIDDVYIFLGIQANLFRFSIRPNRSLIAAAQAGIGMKRCTM